jgi:hypothetical protein
MPDERTYGFHRDDAEALMQSISAGETWYPEIKPRGNNSGGGHHIWFTIDEVYCEDAHDDWHLIATPNWYTRGCTATPPGADEYTGQVKVYDICDIHGYYNADELPGSKGRATYMYPLDGECEPRWILDTLCKQPECA